MSVRAVGLTKAGEAGTSSLFLCTSMNVWSARLSKLSLSRSSPGGTKVSSSAAFWPKTFLCSVERTMRLYATVRSFKNLFLITSVEVAAFAEQGEAK